MIKNKLLQQLKNNLHFGFIYTNGIINSPYMMNLKAQIYLSFKHKLNQFQLVEINIF